MENRTETERSFLSYLEPAVILTVLAASLYLIGINREAGFLHRLGVGSPPAGDPIFYLVQSQVPIVSFVILGILFLWLMRFIVRVSVPDLIRLFDIFPENSPAVRMLKSIQRVIDWHKAIEALFANSPLFILALIFGDWSRQGNSQDGGLNIGYLLIAVACLGAFLYYLLRVRKFYEAFMHGSFLERIIIVVILVTAGETFAYMNGTDEAVTFIEKKKSTNLLIEFKWTKYTANRASGKRIVIDHASRWQVLCDSPAESSAQICHIIHHTR